MCDVCVEEAIDTVGDMSEEIVEGCFIRLWKKIKKKLKIKKKDKQK